VHWDGERCELAGFPLVSTRVLERYNSYFNVYGKAEMRQDSGERQDRIAINAAQEK